MRTAPRMMLGWRGDSATKLYLTEQGAYQAMARRMFEARYMVHTGNERFHRYYCETVPVQMIGSHMHSTGSQMYYRWENSHERINRTMHRLARFMAYVDRKRGTLAMGLAGDQLSREIQRLEQMATAIMLRVRELESGR